MTAYDIMTPEDAFYFHHLNNLCLGVDIARWPLVKSLVDLGQNLIDANSLATLANETIYISDQPRAAPLIKIVKECASILQVEPPPVHIEGDPEPNAYVAGLREPHVLVLTSSLLDLYDESPEELRFIIGHELGHIKAGHIKTHFLGSTLVEAVRGDTGKKVTFADDFIAAFAVGALLHWYRESEYSADRAGLICVGGDVAVARQALLRLLHRTKPSNKLLDPSHPEFDAALVLKHQLRLREEPFVKIVSYFREMGADHPFIPERCASLGTWALSAQYETLIARAGKQPTDRSLVVTNVAVTGIPSVDTYVPLVDSGATDPFAKLTYDGTTSETGHLTDVADAKWTGLSSQFAFCDGASVILELFDYNTALSSKLIGSCLLPVKSDARGEHSETVDLRLDVLEPSTIVDRPRVTITYRIDH
ncbi:MAG: M48 family metalloprotease [Pirellulales bacterium]